MKSGIKKLYLLLIAVVILMFAGITVQGAFASEISSCKIDTSAKNKVNISARAPMTMANTDGYYYIYGLLPYETSVTRDSVLAAKVKQNSILEVSCPLNLNNQNSLLYRKFAIAVKKENGFQIISNYMYITNPECLAPVKKAFPKPASKKGLHIKPTMISDAEDLSIKHAAVNICLDLFIASDSQKNKSASIPYTYQGKQYWFRKLGCSEVDPQVKQLSESGVVISGILLLRNQGAGKLLIPSAARNTKKNYYGINATDKTGVETLEALMHFLGDRYMNSNGKNGTIVNWIVGNEVNNCYDYNYLGEIGFNEYVQQYTDAFRICDVALRSVYSNARVYISLDHLWNGYQGHHKNYTSKSMLDGFAACLKNEGDLNWNLAFHPYPAPLTDPVFWDDKVSYSDSTVQVTMKNLNYLTDYVTNHFRKDVRIILSEQGFTSKTNGVSNEKLQAAAYAYAYYLTEFNDKVDSFIMNRHVDHVEETKQGLFLGIWTNKKGNLEYADSKKAIWDVFKYIDSSGSESVTRFALQYVPGNSWSSLIPGFSWSRFQKMGGYTNVQGSTFKKASTTFKIANNLRYSYNSSVKKKGVKTTIKPKTGLNPNLFMGAGWTYNTPLNFANHPFFTCNLKITGMKEKYAYVRVRFFSGADVYEGIYKQAGKKNVKLKVNLSPWTGKNEVQKIQIWVRPYNRSKWKKGAQIVVTNMKAARTVK